MSDNNNDASTDPPTVPGHFNYQVCMQDGETSTQIDRGLHP